MLQHNPVPERNLQRQRPLSTSDTQSDDHPQPHAVSAAISGPFLPPSTHVSSVLLGRVMCAEPVKKRTQHSRAEKPALPTIGATLRVDGINGSGDVVG
ncbi:hypothetical protein GX50_02983 [[Emmonsia] crescens]|uniref:Uncharacterized protein n=1 Tax=[Emmonsia] crescens TaxID=73230 RepID=A0A2B7ZM01_9EURO|nr:hypothetical protein GX50_02983 [Emmonsia crescens]